MEVGVFCIVDDNMDKQDASEIVGLEYTSYGKENIMEPQAKQEHKTTYNMHGHTCTLTHHFFNYETNFMLIKLLIN